MSKLHKPIALVLPSVLTEWNVNTGQGTSLEWEYRANEKSITRNRGGRGGGGGEGHCHRLYSHNYDCRSKI